MRSGKSDAKTRPSRGSGIREAPLRGSGGDGLVERPRLAPRARAGGGDAIPPLANGLVADDDGLVPSLDKPIALEPGHQLVERGTGTPHSVVGDDIADDTPWLLGRQDDTEREELEVRQRGKLAGGRHKVALYTISDSNRQWMVCLA